MAGTFPDGLSARIEVVTGPMVSIDYVDRSQRTPTIIIVYYATGGSTDRYIQHTLKNHKTYRIKMIKSKHFA